MHKLKSVTRRENHGSQRSEAAQRCKHAGDFILVITNLLVLPRPPFQRRNHGHEDREAQAARKRVPRQRVGGVSMLAYVQRPVLDGPRLHHHVLFRSQWSIESDVRPGVRAVGSWCLAQPEERCRKHRRHQCHLWKFCVHSADRAASDGLTQVMYGMRTCGASLRLLRCQHITHPVVGWREPR